MHHQHGIRGAPSQHPTTSPASAPGISWETQPLHLVVLQAHPFHLPALTIILLIATGGVSPSLSYPPHLLKECHLLCTKPQEKGIRQPGFHQAAAPGGALWRATKVPGASKWGFFNLRTRRLSDGWLKLKADPPQWCTKNSNRSSKEVRELFL